MKQQFINAMSRRRFLELTGIVSSSLLLHLDLESVVAEDTDTDISRVIMHTFDPNQNTTDSAIRAALLATSNFSWLHSGDSVFVKVASNSNLSSPSVTSPAVLGSAVRFLLEAGAGTVYVGDMSGAQFVRHLPDETIGSTRENMRQNGLLEAAEAAGATIHCFEEVPYAQAYIPGIPSVAHHWADELYVAEILDRVDHIVNLPRLGKHVLAGATLGLKNAVGWISDQSRGALHRDGHVFQEKIAEINAIPQLANKQRLTLTLVDKILTTYGPDAGYHLPLDKPIVIASDDIVSHDQIALLTLLWARQQTPHTVLQDDPYPLQSNGLNAWFVRVYWGETYYQQYQQLPTFDDLAAPNNLTHINYAYDILRNGRPDVIEVSSGEYPLDSKLQMMLTHNPALHINIQDGV
jgi:uncharacterized protein (DUF362 family)